MDIFIDDPGVSLLISKKGYKSCLSVHTTTLINTVE